MIIFFNTKPTVPDNLTEFLAKKTILYNALRIGRAPQAVGICVGTPLGRRLYTNTDGTPG